MCAAIVFWGTGVFRASAAASPKPKCRHLSGQAFRALTGSFQVWSSKSLRKHYHLGRNTQMQVHLVEHEWTKEIYRPTLAHHLSATWPGPSHFERRDRGRPGRQTVDLKVCSDQWVWEAAAIQRLWPGEEWEEVVPLRPLPLPNLRKVSWRRKIGENWKTG